MHSAPDPAATGNRLAIATSGDQGSASIVERSGEEVAFLPDEEQGVQIRSIAFTPDGERLMGSRSPMSA